MAQVCELTLEGATQAGEAPVIVVPGLRLGKKGKARMHSNSANTAGVLFIFGGLY